MTKPQILFQNDKEAKTKRIISFDTETTGDNNEFYLCGVLDGDEYNVYFNIEEARQKLMEYTKKNEYVYANNLEFDATVLFFNEEWISQLEPIYANSRMISAKIRRQRGSVKLVDAMNYGGFSVATQGKIIGYNKLEKPRCIGRKPRNKEELNELIAYNKTDCVITKRYVELVQSGLNALGSELKLTIASSALDLYTRRFLKNTTKHERVDVTKIFEAYYGGRTEAFTRGLIHKAFKIYDVNSLYPAMMLKEFPVPSSAVKECNINEFGVSEAIVEAPRIYYPFLPYRADKLLFPYGRFKGFYTNHELLYARDVLNYKVKVLRSLNYRKVETPFKDYVTELYKLRKRYKETNNPFESVAKLLMNSLYGKFASRHETKTTLYVYDGSAEQRSDEDIKWNLNGIGYKTEEQNTSRGFKIPIYSIYVTAYARMKLYEYITKYNALYVDTDSVFSFKDMNTSLELGEMKLEAKVKDGIIIKPKMYLVDTETVQKVRAKGFKGMNPADFNKVIRGEMFEYVKFAKLKESIIRKLDVNKKIVVAKKADLNDDKRLWRGNFDATKEEVSEPLCVDASF